MVAGHFSGTAADFPFGIVQLSAWGGATGSTPATGKSLNVAATRWGQVSHDLQLQSLWIIPTAAVRVRSGWPPFDDALRDLTGRVLMTMFSQSANFGYAPNPKQPRTFMAVALDLAAFQGGCCAGRSNCNTYPGLCIHP